MTIILLAWFALFFGKLSGLIVVNWLIVIFFPVLAVLAIFLCIVVLGVLMSLMDLLSS